MAVIPSISDLIRRQTGGVYTEQEPIRFVRRNRFQGQAGISHGAGTWTSMWLIGGQPGLGAVPDILPTVPDNTTPGSLRQANATGGRKRYIAEVAVAGFPSPGVFMIYDRLLHNGGLSATVTGTQAIGGVISRYTTGFGNRIYLEVAASVGTNSVSVTAEYTNHLGNTAVTRSAAFGASSLREVGRMIELPLASGDLGVRSVQSVTLAASTGIAGSFGVLIAHPLVVVPIGATAAWTTHDFISGPPVPPEIVPDACLAMAYWVASTSTIEFVGSLTTVEA